MGNNDSVQSGFMAVRSSKTDLVQRVVRQLRDKIVENLFESDSYLAPEAVLAEQMNVSRPVIREALKVLSAQGLVELSQGKRAKVKSPDPKASIETLEALLRRSDTSHRNLIQARVIIEGEIAALAALNANEDDLKRLEELNESAMRAGKDEGSVHADLAIHLCIADICGNPILSLVIHSLRALMEESVRRTMGMCSSGSHLAIIDAIKRREPQEAREAMREHLREKESFLLGTEGK